MNRTDWQAKRRHAAHRKRRIIFNNDGGDSIGHVIERAGGIDGVESSDPPGSAEWFWTQRCYGLEDSHVDAIFYHTGAAFNTFNHDTRVGYICTSVDGLWSTKCYAKTMIEQGRDCLQLIIDFARKTGKEAFWTLRMNDIHDNWTPAEYPQFKKDHPQLLLFQPDDIGRGRTGMIEPHMYATAVDYAQAEIRDRVFEIIEDVCCRYDIDGIEFDFMRQPVFFRPTLEGRPVEQEHLDLMTDLVERVRRMTEEVGQKRGRPLLVACRAPCRESSCNEIGLDIRRWAASDLCDMIVSSIEFEPFTGPLGEMVNIGREHDIPVYADLSRKVSLHYQGLHPDEAWMASAVNSWNAGVDGVYTFNLFDPYSQVLRTIGDPQMMATMDKVYLVDNIAGRYRTWEHVLPPEGRLPLELPLDEKRSVNLPVGDDLALQAERETLASFHLRFYIDNFTYSDEIACRLNGRDLPVEVVYSTEGLSPVVCGTFMFRARPAPSLLKKGDNLFEIILKKRCASAVGAPVLNALQLPVRYQ